MGLRSLLVGLAGAILAAAPALAQEITTLTVTESAGVARADEPVTSGVPLPKGLVKDVSELALKTADGKDVPASFSLLNKWPEDGSVRWALLDTNLSVPVDGSVKLSLVKGTPAVARPVAVTETDDAITVDTGMAKFAVSRHGFKMFDSLSLGGTPVLSTPAGGLTAVIDGKKYTTAADRKGTVTVEERTPMRVALLAKGKLADAGGRAGFDYEVRIHAYAGSPVIKVVATVINKMGPRRDSHPKLSDLSIELPLAAKGATTYALGTDKNAPAVGAVSKSAYVNVTSSDSFVLGGDASGSGKCKSSKPLTLGWGDASSGGVGVAAGVRRFWQNFPKAIEVKPGELVVHLYPSTEPEPVEVYCGMARTHEVLIVPHAAGTPTDLQAKFVAFQEPLFAFASPKWYCRDSGGLGLLAESAEVNPGIYGAYSGQILAFDQKMDGIFKALAGPHQDHWQKRGVTMDTYGWLNYGDTLHWVWLKGQDRGVTQAPGTPWTIAWDGNYYDMPQMALVHFARTGNRAVFDFFVDHSWHLMDVDVIHYLPGAQFEGGGGSRRCPATNHVGFDPPQHAELAPNYAFDHHKSESLFNRYYLLGDRWSLEVATELLNHAFDPKGNGGRNGDYSGTRKPAHQILTLVAGYWETGDKKYLAKAREVIDTGLELQKKYDGGLNAGKDGKPAANFTDGILAESWSKYYRVTGEKDVLDGVIALENFLTTHEVIVGRKFKASEWGNGAMGAGLAYLRTGDDKYLKFGLACLADPKVGHLSKDSADFHRNAGFFCGLLVEKLQGGK
ncbi:MAG: hypothetical protein BIFFINMI_01049 [Phycisphaerae bacterium]|nr:hypothetical protein [Phycisphaerae bacterium]